ncbi:MAG: OadG family protein [Rectinemataceae bacterium]
MDNVWLITVLGIGTVFLALISLALATSLFPKVFGRRAEKVRLSMAPLPQMSGSAEGSPVQAHAVAASAPGMDGIGSELVAVIAAAIAAASGAAPDNFRVASIAPVQNAGGFNTPVWGRIERLTRN